MAGSSWTTLRIMGLVGGVMVAGALGAPPAVAVDEPVGPVVFDTPQPLGAVVSAGFIDAPRIVDVDSDGRPDLLTLDRQDTNGRRYVTVRLGVGDGTFGAPKASEVARATEVWIFDATGDDVPDAVIHRQGTATTNNHAVEVFPGIGDGTFAETASQAVTVSGELAYPGVVGDFDGDGRIDVAGTVSNPGSSDVTIATFYNTGSGLVRGPTTSSSQGYIRIIYGGADLTGDGRADLLVSGNDLQGRVYSPDAQGVFSVVPNPLIPMINEFSTRPAMADFTGDGWVDIAAATLDTTRQSNFTAGFRLYPNQGGGAFNPNLATISGPRPTVDRGYVPGDVDGDGDQDIVGWRSGTLDTYLNDGTGHFTWAQSIDSSMLYELALGDVDGDRRPEALVGQGEATLPTAALFRNVSHPATLPTDGTTTTATPATAPDPPTVSGVSVGNHSATITWLRPADGGSTITGYTVTATPGGATCSTHSADELTCTITGLTNGVSYTFTVTARNAVGESPAGGGSGSGGGGTSGSGTPGTQPSPVMGVDPMPDPDDGTKVTVRWLAAASDLPIVSYRATAAPGGEHCATTGALFCTITGLTPGVDYTFTVVAINGAGSSEPSDPVGVPSDTTAPTVSATYDRAPVSDGSTDWFNGPVVLTWNVVDNPGGSGVPVADVPAPVTVATTGDHSSGSVCDAAGNCAAATAHVGVDTAGPQITISAVIDGNKYVAGTAPSPTCSATDEGSGVDGSCSVVVTGGNANGVGAFTVTATALDRVGNRSIATRQFKVIYRWGGFSQPINNTAHEVGGGVSVFKAGSTVPVKFVLLDDRGQPVQPLSAPTWLTPAKGNANTQAVDESVYDLPADSGATFRLSDGQWQYNWKTAKNQAGFYWRIGVQLDDGEIHYVNIGLN